MPNTVAYASKGRIIAGFLGVVLAAVIWSGAMGVHLSLQVRPLGVSPDGAMRWLVLALFTDGRGRQTTPRRGGNVEFTVSRGDVQWQTRARFNAPSAIISTMSEGPLDVKVTTDRHLGRLSARTTIGGKTRRQARVVAAALGPHLVQIGWFPWQLRGTTKIVRSGPDGDERVVGLVGSPSSTYRDATVVPGVQYRYTVLRYGHERGDVTLSVPHDLPGGSVMSLAGKGMWLEFSPDPNDEDDPYTSLDPPVIIDRAARAGLRFIELRTAYGEYWEITPEVKPVIDALLDRAAERGIAVVGWTVPRTTSFDDLAQSIATASYVTPLGHRFAALAVDAERGDEFMGIGMHGYAALTDEMRLLRTALGPKYPLIATIEDPFVENLTNAAYPYRAIAASVNALQPMVYWHVLAKRGPGGWSMEPADVRAVLRSSYTTTLRQTGRRLPIFIGGQTAPLGSCGAPSSKEIAVSLQAARGLGALGIVFFDWSSTSLPQWRAIAGCPWNRKTPR